nr:hypothetical protein [Tanacetum cinerariifolium]
MARSFYEGLRKLTSKNSTLFTRKNMGFLVADRFELFSRAPFTLLASYSLLPYCITKSGNSSGGDDGDGGLLCYELSLGGYLGENAKKVCLLLVATIVFMGRETRYNIPDNVLELVDDLSKNERNCKKDKDKSVEPPKKKIKVSKVTKKKNKYVEVSLEKMTRYNLYGFLWAVKICIYIMEISPTVNIGGRRTGCDTNDYMDKENALCEFDAIRPDDHDEPDNSYIVDKEDILGEFDAIKATISIIDKRKGESDSGVSDVFHQELASEKHQFISEGSGYIYEESQEKYFISQLLQLASNEKSGTTFDCTQLEVDNPIDWSLPNLNEPFSQSQICVNTNNN